jgi:hypothetical protein
MYQSYRYSTLGQKDFDDIVDTCDEDDEETSETAVEAVRISSHKMSRVNCILSIL